MWPIKRVASTPMKCLILLWGSMFQVFQVTTLVIRGPPTSGEKFSIRLDRITIKEEEVFGVLLCVQDFVRSPHFTQRSFFSNQAWRCYLNLLLSLIPLHQVLFIHRGVLWSPRLRARSSLIHVLVGIGWCYVVALLKTPVSTGIMLAPLGVRQRQGQGWEYRTSLMRGALSTCQMLRLILFLLGQAKSVLIAASRREKSPEVQWSCHTDLKSRVLQLVPRGDP